MSTSHKLFSLKTFWGQYLVFSIILLIFSCGVFTSDHPDYPNKFVHLFFHYFGSHLFYWVLYLLFFRQLMGISTSNYTLNNYVRSLVLILILSGIAVCTMCMISGLNGSFVSQLAGCTYGFAFILAGYQLRIRWRELNPSN